MLNKLWSTFSLHIGHIPKTLNYLFTRSGRQVFSKALVKIEGKVLFVIETHGYYTENDATSLAKFDLNDPKTLYMLVVLCAMNEVANKTTVYYHQHKTEQHSSQCVNYVRLAKEQPGVLEVCS